MSLQEKKAVVQRVADWVIEGKLEEVRELFTSDFINHDDSKCIRDFTSDFSKQDASAPTVRDREALMQTFAEWDTAFSDGHVRVEDMVAEGDRVVQRWTYHATHTGEFMGIPATGKELTITATTTYRLSGGKVAECWWNYDNLGIMHQLGVIPPMGGGEE